MEIWKAVPGYEGFYEVSDLGRVRSLPRVVHRERVGPLPIRGRVLKSRPDRNGYPMLALCRDGERKGTNVHRIVGIAFLGVGPDDEVDHRDGNRSDCRLSNLRKADHFLNKQNSLSARVGKWGRGVHYAPHVKKWAARIRTFGKTKHLGHFATPEAAAAARLEAERKEHGEFALCNRPNRRPDVPGPAPHAVRGDSYVR